jgi:hypothetical protein
MKKTLPSVNTIPPEILEILGPPPILSSENERVYYATLAYFANLIGPTDIITWFITKDLVDSRVEIARHKRFKASLIDLAKPASGTDPLRELMAQISGNAFRPVELVWEGGIQKRVEEAPKIAPPKVKTERASENNTPVDPASIASQWIPEYQKLDLLECTAERRFAAALHELNYYRNGLGRELQEALQTTIDGEFTESSPSGGQPMNDDGADHKGTRLSVERALGEGIVQPSEIERKGLLASDRSENVPLGARRRKPRGIRR